MTPTSKKHQARQIAAEGQQLVSQAETLLKQVVRRNARLSQEVKQTRAELEEKIASQTK